MFTGKCQFYTSKAEAKYIIFCKHSQGSQHMSGRSSDSIASLDHYSSLCVTSLLTFFSPNI